MSKHIAYPKTSLYRSLVRSRLERRRFTTGNSSQFQGDERDVMFLSMVDSPIGGPLRLVQTDAIKQRYNVSPLK